MINAKSRMIAVLMATLILVSAVIIPVSAAEGSSRAVVDSEPVIAGVGSEPVANDPATKDEADSTDPTGTTEPVVQELKGTIKVVNSNVIRKIDGNTAYVGYGDRLRLDLSGLNWDDFDTLKITYIDGSSDNVSKYDADIMDYALRRVYSDVVFSAVVGGKTVKKSISSYTGFQYIDYDTNGINIESVAIGTTNLENGKWLLGGDEYGDVSTKELIVTLNSDLQKLKTINCTLNDRVIELLSPSNGVYKADVSDFKTTLQLDNKLVLTVENEYGTKVSKTITFNYDGSTPKIGEAVLDDNNYKDGSYIYTKSGVKLKAGVDSGVSGFKSLAIYRNGAEYKTLTDVPSHEYNIEEVLDEEGIYSIGFTTTSGKAVYSLLFNGKSIRFDDEKPAIKSISYVGDIDISKWFNKVGIFEIVVEDNRPFDVKDYSIVLNGNTVEADSISTGNGGKEITIGLDLGKHNVIQGDNIIDFTMLDKLGNDVGFRGTIKVDTVKPKSTDIITNIDTVRDGVTYYKDKLVISGSFKEEGSGLKGIYYAENGKDFIEVATPLEIKEGGIVRVEDIAGNRAEYTTENLLKELGVADFRIDRDEPDVGLVAEEPQYIKSGYDYYGHKPTELITINDDNLDYAEILVNGEVEKKLQPVDLNSDGGFSYVPKNLVEGLNKVSVTAYDIVGHSSSKEIEFFYDISAPKINSATVNKEPNNQKDGKIFYSSDVVVNLLSSDDGVGVSKYTVYHNDKWDSYDIASTGDVAIQLKNNEEYRIVVEDHLGNKTEVKTLGELLGWEGNRVVYDDEKPDITPNIPDNSYSKRADWYGSDVEFSFDVSDNQGIDAIVVSINGTVVDSRDVSGISDKNFTVKADTSKVQPEDGRYEISVTARDNALNPVSWSKTIYIDKNAPRIANFLITGDVKRTGKSIDGSEGYYGFFFNGSGNIEVSVADEGVSAGIYCIYTKLDGQDWVRHETAGGLTATVAVPSDYKGTLRAKVEDNVSHESTENMPDGLVSESANTYVNNTGITIEMPTPVGTDISGNPLYRADTTAGMTVRSDWSGIESISWGIGENTYDTITDMSSPQNVDKNLVLRFSTVANAVGNANGLEFWVVAKTNTGYTVRNSKIFSIDKDAPIINLSFDKTVGNGYYNSTRVATITVTERNFDSNNFGVSGNAVGISGWSNSGDTWTTTMSFESDGDYQFTLSCTDRAGNVGSAVSSDKFTIDKTAPVMSVSWNNSDVRNGLYYKEGRVAIVTVVERNFSPDLFSVSGGSFSGWSNSGDTWTTSVSCVDDGTYQFSINGSDLATNSVGSPYDSGSFIVDKVSPKIVVSGVENGISYKKDLAFSITIDDKYMDYDITNVKIYGKNHKDLNIKGTVIGDTIVFSYGDFPKEEGIDDVYTLVITGVDRAGNISSEDIQFSVNRFGSKFSFYDADILGNYLNEAKDIKITETNVDKLDTSKIKIVVSHNGNDVVLTEKEVKIDIKEVDGKYVYTYTIDKKYFAEDGKYTIQVYSSSDDGTEYTSVTEEYSFVIDTTEPEIVVSGVENNGSYQAYEKTVTIEVRDLSDIGEMLVQLNGSRVSTSYNEKEGFYSLVVKESDNRQNMSVSVTDKAGNSSVVEVLNFSITSNPWVFIVNQAWFWVLIILLIVIILLLIALMVWRIHKSRAEEKALAKENDAYYRGSSSGNSGDSEETGVMPDNDDLGATSVQEDNVDDSPTDIME